MKTTSLKDTTSVNTEDAPQGKAITLPTRDPETSPLPEAYYFDGGGKDYFFRATAESQQFVRLNMESLRRHLKGMDYDTRCPEAKRLSELDVTLNRIQIEHHVAYAGPLAGHKVGMFEADGEQVLVTDPPTIIEPQAGEWNTLYTFISNLLGSEQETYFFGWLKTAYEAVRNSSNRPGQALFLAGPVRAGKSLFLKLISTVLGGQARTANPYQSMIGRTDFNSDLFRAEHLIIDDHPAINTIKEKQFFTSQLKEIINTAHKKRCHGKGTNAIMLNPIWRISIALNDSDENIGGFLNWSDDGIEDKLMLFKVNFHEMPMPTHTDEERAAFWRVLTSELPAMLDYLTQWKIPEELRSPRFGVRHWHHPEILEKIKEQQPELILLEMIDEVVRIPADSPLKVSALELESTLGGVFRDEMKKLCPHSTTCGRLLGLLAKQFPKRVQKPPREFGKNDWLIYASPSAKTLRPPKQT